MEYKDELKDKIAKLKKKRNAIIIVHNYQRDEVQDIADVTGDSLALSQAVVGAEADVIVFCGVDFMAESASILNPEKIVLLPVKEAWCPMANMITVEKLRAKKKEYPDAAVVCYVNSSADVKAESDICCTSSNAIEVVKSLREERVIFIPDKNLARYVQTQVPQKKIIPWNGFCPTHIRLTEMDVIKSRSEHLQAEFVAHPECNPEVLARADHICSTGGMFKYVKKSSCKEFIIGTECGMLYRLKKENPEKAFYLPTDRLVCPTMKLTTLGWVAHSLEEMVNQINVPDETRVKAQRALDRMLMVSKEKSGAAIAGY
ncbi:MAG: quinolinate synthase NadA [Candidatus Omnitrophica bacterium]|nr:quinolinate synthase NadA [Candidatus Omnitrophota bacterium]